MIDFFATSSEFTDESKVKTNRLYLIDFDNHGSVHRIFFLHFQGKATSNAFGFHFLHCLFWCIDCLFPHKCCDKRVSIEKIVSPMMNRQSLVFAYCRYIYVSVCCPMNPLRTKRSELELHVIQIV